MATAFSRVFGPAAGYYKAGQALTFQLRFSGAAYYDTSTPAITVVCGSNNRTAAYTGGNGTDTIAFSYTVQSGDDDSDGLAVSMPGETAFYGTASWTASTPKITTAGASFPKIKIDTASPIFGTATTVASGWKKAGDKIVFTVEFSEKVFVFGSPEIPVVVGSGGGTAVFDSGNGTTLLKFIYTVQPGDTATAGITLSPPAPWGSSVVDQAGNQVDLSAFSGTEFANIKIDTTVPTVVSVTGPSAGLRKLGDALQFSIQFSEAVHANGFASIPIALGDSKLRQADYKSGTGTNTIVFSYTITASDSMSSSTITATPPIDPGDSVNDRAGNPVPINFTPAAFPSITIDASAPQPPKVALTIDTGSSSSDKITSVGTLAVTSAEVGVTFQYSANGGVSWENKFSAQPGQNSVLVRATDSAGNKSRASQIVFTLDTTPPLGPTIALRRDTGASNYDEITSNAEPLLCATSLEFGGTVQYSTDGGTIWANTAKVSALLDGARSILARQIDVAGNASSPVTLSITLDKTAPTALSVALKSDTGASSSDNISQDGGFSVSGETAGCTTEYSSDNGASWRNDFEAVEGVNSLQVRQKDVAGNVSPSARLRFTLDTTSPAAPIAVMKNTETDTATTTYTPAKTSFLFFKLDAGASVQYSGNGSTWSDTFSPQQGEAVNVYIRQVDKAGNASQPTQLTYSYTP